MVRKIFAIIITIIALFAIKETVFIFTTDDADIVAKRNLLKLISVMITFPLVFAAIVLWRPKPKQVSRRD